jgi:hypothetical protein
MISILLILIKGMLNVSLQKDQLRTKILIVAVSRDLKDFIILFLDQKLIVIES